MGHEMILAITGFVSTVITGVVAFYQIRKYKQINRLALLELRLQADALDFAAFMCEWSETHDQIDIVLDDTPLDRFLLLHAWNGVWIPRWASAVLQLRAGKQKHFSYIHVELDKDYQDRLKEIEMNGYAVWNVDAMPDHSKIKGIYKAEGVKTAAWFFVGYKELPGTESRAVLYCSFATHSAKTITENHLTACRLVANRLKSLADKFNSKALEGQTIKLDDLL